VHFDSTENVKAQNRDPETILKQVQGRVRDDSDRILTFDVMLNLFQYLNLEVHYFDHDFLSCRFSSSKIFWTAASARILQVSDNPG
jgi:hypothetical protein